MSCDHSIALVTGLLPGLVMRKSAFLAAKGYHQVIVNGRSVAQIRKAAALVAAETRRQVFTPLELDLNDPVNIHSAVAALVKQGRPVVSYCSKQGWCPISRACSLRRPSKLLRLH